ncbi:MAG: tRNA (N(6)-L-threonylcarbamoyladenosine(37)-C(2))-methylthiotransferase [Nanoarchaeota archaeon]|nr:tRNA (N(6)-L-threonylcarbamoyladenosine(37)-C(2))-methylthiotransferase [Nanoarchaeota archaeon]
MAKIHFLTQGCSANVADSEVMMGLLQEAGHVIVDSLDDADLIVFNTCTVKGPTENFFWRKLEILKDRLVLVAGCIPQSEQDLSRLEEHSLVGTYDIDRICEAVNETLNGDRVVFLSKKNRSRLNLPKCRVNPLVEIVPISHGCLGSCNYCITKRARGELHSYPVKDIVKHIRNSDAKQIWLTSQDNGAYGLDIDTDLIELLYEIVAIPGDFKVRVGMANPEHVKMLGQDLIKAFKNEKIYKFLHLPVQSGSDSVLKAMGRKYTVDDFKNIMKSFRKAFPMINIATDIICGFPTETEEDFQSTLDLIKETKLDIINISRFWPRPGTKAAEMEQQERPEIKRRTKMVTELFHRVAAETNRRWIGWQGQIMIAENGKPGSFIGRNFAYKQVVLKDEGLSIGQVLDVRIDSAMVFDIRGKII